MKCENCGKEHDGSYGSGRFCSRSCANTRKLTIETKQKIAKSCTNKVYIRKNKVCGANVKSRISICEVCKHEFVLNRKENGRWPSGRFCSDKCRAESYHAKQHITSKKCGGYKPHGGKGKRGWYKGYWCDSSWELAWVIYNLDHGIKFERNTIGFPYQFNNEMHKYHPDFKLSDGSFVEIKGWYDPKTIVKHEAFRSLGYKLIVVDKNNIDLYLKYAKEKYGNNYIKAYEC